VLRGGDELLVASEIDSGSNGIRVGFALLGLLYVTVVVLGGGV
jgi:hypothetical protein